MNVIKRFIFASFLFASCNTKKENDKFVDSSWYLSRSTDTTMKILNTDTIFATFNAVSRNICVYQFSADNKVKEKLLVPNVAYGLVSIDSYQRNWELKNDTLIWGDDQFLIKTITKDSLLLQKIDNRMGVDIINTYYRIGI